MSVFAARQFRQSRKSAATAGTTSMLRTPIHIRIRIQIQTPIQTRTRIPIRASTRRTDVIRTAVTGLLALLAITVSANDYRETRAQTRSVRDLIAELAAVDPAARARAACDIRELGDTAADAIAPLAAMLGDAAPVEALVCNRSWWRGNANDLTSPGEQAAAALVAIGTRAFQPVLARLKAPPGPHVVTRHGRSARLTINGP